MMSSMNDTTWTALLVAAAGGLGAFGGAGLTAWFTLRSQDRAHRQEQRLRDAEVVGPVLDYLVDSDPTRLAMNASPDPQRQSDDLAALKERRDQLRASVLVLAAGHPDPIVRARARELSVALYNALSSAAWAVRDLEFHTDRSALEVATGDHAAAQEAAECVLEESTRYADSGKTRVRRKKPGGTSP
jgi:hypothetical protein